MNWLHIIYSIHLILVHFVNGFVHAVALIISKLFVKPFNFRLYTKISYYFCYSYISVFAFFFEWYSGSEIYLHMDKDDYDKYFGKESSFVISNHPSEIDVIIQLALSGHGNCLGHTKSFSSNKFQYVPGLGLNSRLADCIMLERSYENDKKSIEETVTKITKYPDPVWLILFAEGTRFSEDKHKVSMKFAQQHGFPLLKYHLWPRTKGFQTSLKPIRNKMDAVYDMTITFDLNDGNEPTVTNLFSARAVQCHIYAKRIPFGNVPQEEKKAAQFIHDMYIQKDKLVDNFYKTGRFIPNSNNINKLKLKRSYLVLMNMIILIIFTDSLLGYIIMKLIETQQFVLLAVIFGILVSAIFGLYYLINKLKATSSYGTDKIK